MATCAIVGINWGDEGKGRMVDWLASQYDIVVRYQGGSNAGHTVVNEYGKFALNLLPSGIFRQSAVNILGNGTVIDPEHLLGEIGHMRGRGIPVGPDNLRISERACLVFPYHKAQDALEEARLLDRKYGSTKRGIAPVYGDKYMKKAIQMGELLLPRDRLAQRVASVLEWKNLTIAGVYGQEPYRLQDVMDWLDRFGAPLRPFIGDTALYLHNAHASGRSILFEAQLGALRDVDYGIYPYTSSSSPLAAFAPVGSGLPEARLDRVVGVVKAYSTCVGEGPFVCEWFGEDAETLRRHGEEYGAATGRPRRVGPLDLVATRYGVRVQGATELALTKLDVLSYMETIPVCTGYRIGAQIVREFPFTPLLDGAEPVLETLPGFGEDVSAARAWEDLPKAARDYVEYVEAALQCRIPYVSVGPDRDALILR